MDTLNLEAAFSFFVCGLAWLSVALGMALSRRSSRTPSVWLIACFALPGAAAWAGAMMAREAAVAGGRLYDVSAGSGSAAVCEFARLALLAGSLVALVEYGQRRLARHRVLLPGRWIYAVLAAWTAIGPFVVEQGWLEFGYRALLAWPGVMLPALFLHVLTKKQRLARRGSLAAALGLLLAAAVVGCLPLGVVQPAVALFAAVTLWLVFARRASARPAPMWRRAAAPAAFVLALVAGWFAIVGHSSPRPDDILADRQDITSLIEEIEGEAPPKEPSKLDRQLERCGLAMAPIAALVLAVWGLSRLPFAR